MQPVYLLDDSLYVEVFFSEEDCDLEDNICLRVIESCKEEERIFRHDESQLCPPGSGTGRRLARRH